MLRFIYDTSIDSTNCLFLSRECKRILEIISSLIPVSVAFDFIKLFHDPGRKKGHHSKFGVQTLYWVPHQSEILLQAYPHMPVHLSVSMSTHSFSHSFLRFLSHCFVFVLFDSFEERTNTRKGPLTNTNYYFFCCSYLRYHLSESWNIPCRIERNSLRQVSYMTRRKLIKALTNTVVSKILCLGAFRLTIHSRDGKFQLTCENKRRGVQYRNIVSELKTSTSSSTFATLSLQDHHVGQNNLHLHSTGEPRPRLLGRHFRFPDRNGCMQGWLYHGICRLFGWGLWALRVSFKRFVIPKSN